MITPDVSCENLVFSSRGSKSMKLQETSGDEKMNSDSAQASSIGPACCTGPGVRNSRMPKEPLDRGGAPTPLPDPRERLQDPGKALYGLRVDFDAGEVTRLYIHHARFGAEEAQEEISKEGR